MYKVISPEGASHAWEQKEKTRSLPAQIPHHSARRKRGRVSLRDRSKATKIHCTWVGDMKSHGVREVFLGWDSVIKGAPGTGGWAADSSSTLRTKGSSPGHRSLLLFSSGESVLLRKTFPLAGGAVTAPLGSGCWGSRRGEGPCIFCQSQLLPSRARSRKNYRIFTSARLLVSPSPTPPW